MRQERMRISIIGAGAMGGAIAEGLLKAKVMNAAEITLSAPHQETLDKFVRHGMSVTTDNREAVNNADMVVLAVKPWLAEEVLSEIKDVMHYDRQMLVSVVAGLSSYELQRWLKRDGQLPAVFLLMPNTAISQCESVNFIVPVESTPEQTRQVVSVFERLGMTLVVEERQLAAGTMLSGCGIAYALRYIRAATEGGVELGFKAKDAQKIVEQTLKGAVELLKANGTHPEEEIDKVTTPGGMTIKGLNEMEKAGFTSAVIRGLKAGMERKKE